MTAPVSAAWSLDALTLSVGRRGWGDALGGKSQKGVRAVLDALWRLLPHESAEGDLTAAQVADVAGYSLKWTRHCLAQLEDLGVITWRRGYLDNGRPKAGWIRVCKRRLAELVRRARGFLDDVRHARAEATRQRLADTLNGPISTRKPLSRRWEVTSTLPTPKGSNLRFTRPPGSTSHLPGLTMAYCQTCNLTEDACLKANSRVRRSARHKFIARSNPRALIQAPIIDNTRPIPAGWRSLTRPAHPELDYQEGNPQ